MKLKQLNVSKVMDGLDLDKFSDFLLFFSIVVGLMLNVIVVSKIVIVFELDWLTFRLLLASIALWTIPTILKNKG